MPLQYVTNQSFTTSSSLLGTLRDTLVASGWGLVTDSPTTIELIGQSFNDFCFLQANIVTRNGTQDALELRGSSGSSFIVLSPVVDTTISASSETGSFFTPLDLRYTVGSSNSVWITSSEDAFVIAISDALEPSSYISAWRFGFYDRPEPFADPFGWGYGPVHFGPSHNYVARSFFDNTDWYEISSGYNLSTFYDSSNYNYSTTAYGFTQVFQNNIMKGWINPFSTCVFNRPNGNNTSGNQVSGNFYRGNSNGVDGSIKPFPLWIQEYYGSGLVAFTGRTPLKSVYRGTVKFCATGFGHFSPGTVTTISGVNYLTLGLGSQSAIIIG